jgi:hypothetical protein
VRTRSSQQEAAIIPELAYWDERVDGVRTRVRLEDGRTFACVVTRAAAGVLASTRDLPPRKCFKVVRDHAHRIAEIARAKVESRGEITPVVVPDDLRP